MYLNIKKNLLVEFEYYLTCGVQNKLDLPPQLWKYIMCKYIIYITKLIYSCPILECSSWQVTNIFTGSEYGNIDTNIKPYNIRKKLVNVQHGHLNKQQLKYLYSGEIAMGEIFVDLIFRYKYIGKTVLINPLLETNPCWKIC